MNRPRDLLRPLSCAGALLLPAVLAALPGCAPWSGDQALVVGTDPSLAPPPPKPPAQVEANPIADALRSPDPVVRVAALHALAQARPEPLPPEALSMTADPNPAVRAAAIHTLARRRHPDAERRAVAGLEDGSVQVRLAAIAALGELGDGAARARLVPLLDDRGELVRAAAVSSLASLGDEEAVWRAREDKSWRVRRAFAEALAKSPHRRAQSAAKQLLDDPSPQVQEQALVSAAHWPIAFSGPVLLEGLGKTVYVTRSTAAQQLARLWPPAAEFPVDGSPDQRAEVIERLRARFDEEVRPARNEDGPAPAVSSSGSPHPAVEGKQVAEVERLIGRLSEPEVPQAERRQAVSQLADFGPGLVEALEDLAIRRGQDLPEPVWHDVLPRFSPALAALDQMNSPELPARRRAAEKLAELAGKKPLEPLTAVRLAALAVSESDPQVLRSMLVAAAGDPSEASARLAYAAIGHPSPEVRRAACEHLAAHPTPDHVRVLAPSLEDAHPPVVAAAVRAMSACRPEDPQPLRRLLSSPNESLRLEAAAALAELGDETGRAALERLAWSGDVNVRRQVAAAMGRSGDRAFVSALVRLLNDQHSVRLAALEALPKVAGCELPEREARSMTMTERIEWWKKRAHADDQAPSRSEPHRDRRSPHA